MENELAGEVTRILARIGLGRAAATSELLPFVYRELHALAGSYLRDRNPAHTLQPTALVHEAFIKLTGPRETAWEGRAHFFAVAARAMRQILANHAAKKRAEKRGGGRQRVTLSDVATPPDTEREIDLLDLDAALARLEDLAPRQARIVEMRYLANLGEGAVAHVLGVSTRTIQREWRMARAFLACELSGDGVA